MSSVPGKVTEPERFTVPLAMRSGNRDPFWAARADKLSAESLRDVSGASPNEAWNDPALVQRYRALIRERATGDLAWFFDPWEGSLLAERGEMAIFSNPERADMLRPHWPQAGILHRRPTDMIDQAGEIWLYRGQLEN